MKGRKGKRREGKGSEGKEGELEGIKLISLPINSQVNHPPTHLNY